MNKTIIPNNVNLNLQMRNSIRISIDRNSESPIKKTLMRMENKKKYKVANINNFNVTFTKTFVNHGQSPTRTIIDPLSRGNKLR